MTALHIDIPYATLFILWAVLIAVACAALVGLAAIARRGNAGPRRRLPSSVDFAGLVTEARELAREAAATAAKAQRAVAVAAVAETRRAETQRAREAAGVAFDAAQRAHDETVAAWRSGEAERTARVRTADEDGQDRTVSKAALAAYRRGDLSVDELREVFRRTGGWDPVQEHREREIGVSRAEAHRAHRAYDAAVAAERIAAKSASVDRVAAHALAEEATEAARDAAAAREVAQWARAARRSPKRPWRRRR